MINKISLILFLSPFFLFGQKVQMPDLLQVKTPNTLYKQNLNFTGSNSFLDPKNPIYNPNLTSSQRNQLMIQQDLQMYEQKSQQKDQVSLVIQDAMQTIQILESQVKYQFQEKSNHQDASHYYSAFEKINSMLEKDDPMNLKKAVFTVENAYYANGLDWQKFDNVIKKAMSLCYLKLKEDGFSMDNNLAKNMAIFKFMTDTTTIQIPGKEFPITTYPMDYDFSDYRGEKDYSKIFVTKLLSTNSGQCHSLPLLYLILARELRTEAYLAYAPSHSYVKFKKGRNRWYNAELTRGMITSDAVTMETGYMKSEALLNRIFLEPMNEKETIASCMVDLVQGYIKKFGYDQFILRTIDRVLEVSPRNIYAWMIKAEYYSVLTYSVGKQLGITDISKAKTHQKFLNLLNTRNKLYQKIDKFGYSEMPKEAYERWLASMESERNKQKHQQHLIRINNALFEE